MGALHLMGALFLMWAPMTLGQTLKAWNKDAGPKEQIGISRYVLKARHWPGVILRAVGQTFATGTLTSAVRSDPTLAFLIPRTVF